MNVLEVTSLRKEFKNVLAIKDISFSMQDGDILAFLGPNGAGKTTTLRILLDIIRPDHGQVQWNVDGNRSSFPSVTHTGYLPEERGLYLDLPVLRTLVYLASIRGMHPSDARKSALQWLEKLELADRAKDKLQTLSKGNQQKIQFIAAILHKPSFLILDEPFSGLDPINQENFIQFIRELHSNGTSILLSSHQMPLVEKLAEKVFLIHQGSEVFHGSLKELYQKAGQQHILEISINSGDAGSYFSGFKEVELLEVIKARQIRVTLKKGTELGMFLGKMEGIKELATISSYRSNLHDMYLSMIKNTVS